jgi:hypothetical protein
LQQQKTAGAVQARIGGEMEERAQQKIVMVPMVLSSASFVMQRLWDLELNHEYLAQYSTHQPDGLLSVSTP